MASAQLKVGHTYSNFTLLEVQDVPEISARGRVFIHKQSGARLTHFETSDSNKVFTCAFATPPSDSTGVPHVLEHSVLCGSKRFPTREPFVELAKGSLQTFLNAFTYNDKTCYPVASQNDKDFDNLMRVYCDAVFHPNIYATPETLEQEGWHYHLEDPKGDIEIKGVVHSEMKGVYSNPESVLERKITQYLYPDTPYSHDSGGEPEVIPNLTHAQFTAFHSKNYHPSNARMYLYGDGDLMHHLALLDDEFLKFFTVVESAAEMDPVDLEGPPQRLMKAVRPPNARDVLKRQEPFTTPPAPYLVEYPVSPAESTEDKAYLSLHWAIGDCTDPFLYLAFDVLEYLLLETPAAPLKQALLQANIGQDVYGSFDTTYAQPAFTVVLKNTNAKHAESFQSIVLDTLKELIKNGIDKKLIEAAINHKEFQLRESDFHSYPKGLIYILTSLESWLHDADPFMHLKFEETLQKVRAALTEPLFENLIATHLVENTHRISLELIPTPGLEEERAKALQAQMAEYKSKLTDEEVAALVQKTKALLARQAKEDSPEALATIPLLDLSEVDPKEQTLAVHDFEFVYPLLSKVESPGDVVIMSGANASAFQAVPILHHPTITNGIVYAQFVFDLADAVTREQLTTLPLLAHVLGKIGTSERTYGDLSMETDIHLGGFKASVNSIPLHGSEDVFRPVLTIQAKFLAKQAKAAMELIAEILTSTEFNDEQRLRELVNEVKSHAEMRIHHRGHAVASRRVGSYLSPQGQFLENIEGISSYHYMRGLAKDYNSKHSATAALLKSLFKSVVRLDRMLVGVTSAEATKEETTVSEDQGAFLQSLPALFGALEKTRDQSLPAAPSGLWGSVGVRNRIPTGTPYEFLAVNKNEGLMSSSKVQYVAKSGSFAEDGAGPFTGYKGVMEVAGHLGSLDYLWNRLRVQGGAYGCWLSFTASGRAVFLSYRDPGLVSTFKTYDDAADYFEKFKASDREVTKNILGTIASRDSPLTASMEGSTMVRRYLSGNTDEMRQTVRDEILKCTVDDVRSVGAILNKAVKTSVVCAFGNEEVLTKNQKDAGLEHLVHVFE